MRTLIALLLLSGVVAAQPNTTFVNDEIVYTDDDGFTISQDQKFDTFPGYSIDIDKSPCIAFELSVPHISAASLEATVEFNGVNPNGSYVAIPIDADDDDWLGGDQNFAWFDAWSDGQVDADDYLDLITEGVFDFDNNTPISWVGGKYTGSLRSTDFVLLPLTPLLNNTFSNPKLTVKWGRAGDVTGDYEIDIDDIDIMQVFIPGEFPSPIIDPYDWDDDGDLDKQDVDICVSFIGLIPGDANGNGTVDVVDFNIIGMWFFQEDTYWSRGDFNSDGVTDVSDFNIWNDNRTDI